MPEEKIVETKICGQCSGKFDITDKDLEFYDKISPVFKGVKYTVPTPTLCQFCRQQRRLTFRNERNFYSRKSDLTEKNIISIYSPDKPYKVYEQSRWWSNEWDPLDYGMDFDFNVGFFEQFNELYKKIPLINLFGQSNDNCDYTFDNNFSKDCYMSVVVDDGENIYYSNRILGRSKDIMDSYYVTNGSSLIYDSLYIDGCYNTRHCFSCSNSKSLISCSFCENCEECIGSKNLKGKKYHIFNEPYEKDEYFKEKTKLNLKTIKEKAEILFLKLPIKNNTLINTENCQGGDLIGCYDCFNCFNGSDSKNIKYSAHFTEANDCYDSEDFCYGVSLNYESHTIIKNNSQILFSLFMMEGNSKCFYSSLLLGCNNCFGCIGLRNTQYCILNKQYTQKEYEELVPKIIEHMKKMGDWGEFFPASISPFGYYETIASEYFPLSREQVLNKGFKWSDYENPKPEVSKIIPASKLPEDISKVPDDILNWAIECEATGKLFRIIKPELDFYRKNNISVPKIHPDRRHLDRMKLRHPRKIYDRNCDKCKTLIKTTRSPDKGEIIYCEECYNREVI